jgi:hypothetical protein
MNIFVRILSLLTLAACGLTLAACTPQTPTEADTTEALTTEEITTKELTEAPTEEETIVEYVYKTVQNPIHNGGGDPWVVQHEGAYYYCFSAGNGVCVGKYDSITELKPNGKRVYFLRRRKIERFGDGITERLLEKKILR